MGFNHGTVVDCPCEGCGDRIVGCHSTCKKFERYSEKVASVKKRRKEEKDFERLFNNQRQWRTYKN